MKINLPNYVRARVLVVGDIILDRYWSGITNRISPEAPVPVVNINSMFDCPGGAANVASNITSLCGYAKLIGYIGDDEPAKILKKRLVQQNVCCDFIITPKHPTITKLRILSRHQQLIRLDFEEKSGELDNELLLKKTKQALNETNLLIISDYNKGSLLAVSKIIKMASKRRIPILIDPKGNNFKRYQGATLLTPNMSEFEAVVGRCQTERQIVQNGHDLIKEYALEALLITRSEKGMILLQRDKKPIYLAANAKDVYDVTGAGDTVIATLGASLAAGSSLEEGCQLANAAAGVVVGKVGTSMVSRIELQQAVDANITGYSGIVTEKELKIAVEAARLSGETIVMTNGCFDILHAGHVTYLEKARRKGNKLIVAINSDASVKKIKGKDRPINSLMQRMLVIDALKVVDWVVPFNEDTPERLINEILPDVLVKGGDYKIEEIAGAADVIAAGGCVEVLDFEAGFSTTAIIRAIKKQ